MRVTKRIEEYVRDEVCKRIPKTKAMTDYETLIKNIDKAQDEINEKVEKYTNEICAEYNKKLGIDHWLPGQKLQAYTSYNKAIYETYDTIERKANIKDEQERREKINIAIKDILLALELGADKKALDEMLNNIK